MSTITQLLELLRALMQDTTYVPHPLDAYIVPSEDEHHNEIVGAADQRRAFISDFHGTVGTAVVLKDQALLWTDGRYHLECAQELDENWTLMKEGLLETPSRGRRVFNYRTFNRIFCFFFIKFSRYLKLEITAFKLIMSFVLNHFQKGFLTKYFKISLLILNTNCFLLLSKLLMFDSSHIQKWNGHVSFFCASTSFTHK